jgi:hypothetical protein
LEGQQRQKAGRAAGQRKAAAEVKKHREQQGEGKATGMAGMQ